MLQDWQARLMIQAQAQAESVLVESMKAKNAERAEQGLAQAYGEDSFYASYDEMNRMAREMTL